MDNNCFLKAMILCDMIRAEQSKAGLTFGLVQAQQSSLARTSSTEIHRSGRRAKSSDLSGGYLTYRATSLLPT